MRVLFSFAKQWPGHYEMQVEENISWISPSKHPKWLNNSEI